MASEDLIDGFPGLSCVGDGEVQSCDATHVLKQSTCASETLLDASRRPQNDGLAISATTAPEDGRRQTSFLDLPRELRDEIYIYTLPRNRLYRLLAHRRRARYTKVKCCFRSRDKWPDIYYALPLFHDEIMEWCYRFNKFSLYAADIDSWFEFTNSRYLGGSPLRYIRHLQIKFEQPRYYAFQRMHIGLEKDAIAATSTAFAYMTPSSWNCGCAISELVDERLSRQDALEDPLVRQRVADSTKFGPVFGLALRLGEALKLDDGPDVSVRGGKSLRRLLLSHCVLCGGRNWSFSR